MRLSRRNFVVGGMALCSSPLLPRFAMSEITLGKASLTTVSDGSLTLPASFLFDGMPAGELAKILDAYKLAPKTMEPECNLALYRDGDKTVLFDVGSGADFMPNAGIIEESLDAIGLSTDDITHVVFTHAHPDHIWGLLDDFDDPLFSEATYMMGRKEWDYWWNPETVNTIGEARAAFAVGAKRRLEAIEDNVSFFDDGDEILSGISAIGTEGHTPGHMGFEIRQGSESVLVIGDAIGNHHVAFHKPEWASNSDQDPERAIQTRQMLFDRLTNEQMRLIGFHLPNGGMGRAEAANGSYRFIEENL